MAPNDAGLLREYGASLLSAGELSRARAALDRAVAADPRAGDPHYLLGEIALRRGDRPAARREFRAHIALEPKSGAHHDLGDLALDDGDRATARSEYAADLAAYPDCYDARINLAALQLAAGDPGAAAREYRASLSYHPEDPRAEAGLARAERALRQRKLAGGGLF